MDNVRGDKKFWKKVVGWSVVVGAGVVVAYFLVKPKFLTDIFGKDKTKSGNNNNHQHSDPDGPHPSPPPPYIPPLSGRNVVTSTNLRQKTRYRLAVVDCWSNSPTKSNGCRITSKLESGNAGSDGETVLQFKPTGKKENEYYVGPIGSDPYGKQRVIGFWPHANDDGSETYSFGITYADPSLQPQLPYVEPYCRFLTVKRSEGVYLLLNEMSGMLIALSSEYVVSGNDKESLVVVMPMTVLDAQGISGDGPNPEWKIDIINTPS